MKSFEERVAEMVARSAEVRKEAEARMEETRRQNREKLEAFGRESREKLEAFGRESNARLEAFTKKADEEFKAFSKKADEEFEAFRNQIIEHPTSDIKGGEILNVFASNFMVDSSMETMNNLEQFMQEGERVMRETIITNIDIMI